MDKCSGCGGFGFIYGLFPPVELKCAVCNGSGYINSIKKLDIKYGEYIKKWRMEQGLTLRAGARKYKIDPSNLSKMERGILKPYRYYE